MNITKRIVGIAAGISLTICALAPGVSNGAGSQTHCTRYNVACFRWGVISTDGRYLATFLGRKSKSFLYDGQTGSTMPFHVRSTGKKGRGFPSGGSISADGRYVTFTSVASNLVTGDTNQLADVFVHDRITGETARVSVGSAGSQADDSSSSPSISADGRYVAFDSWASNLVPGDMNERPDVFVHDRLTGETTRVSIDSAGNQVNDWSNFPSISADGRYVAFDSWASNLVAGDTNKSRDVFVHDRLTGETSLVSISVKGTAANGDSFSPSISADGRYVAFSSDARNLVMPKGTYRAQFEVFIRDRQSQKTFRMTGVTNKKRIPYFSE